jgi:hypothetical protein
MSSHGQCLCESIQYTVDAPLRDVVNCHCSRCRRSTGHFMAATEARREDVHIEGDTLKWYAPVEGTEYGFCGECGSTLFWRTTRTPEVMSIAAGTLTPPTGLRTVEAIYRNYGSDYHVYDETIPSYGEDTPDSPRA